MNRPLVSLDVGGTLGHAVGPSLAAILAAASPLDPREARRIMRHRLHTQPAITDGVVADVCGALQVPSSIFPRDIRPTPLTLVPGALEALSLMNDFATLVTLSNVTCVEAGSDQLRELLSPWVVGQFPSCRIGFAKPDPQAFTFVAQAYATKPSEMVHIGDDWECDIIGATSAGASAIWISNGRPVPDEALIVDSHVLVASDITEASLLIADPDTRRHS